MHSETKTMKDYDYDTLVLAANDIAAKRKFCICDSINHRNRENGLTEIEECRMFNPRNEGSWFLTLFWWGNGTFLRNGNEYNNKENTNSRLLGLAFMLTMPKEML